MIRDFKLLLLGSCCLAVTACAAPNREPDLSNIKSNVDQTREGDFGDFLYNLVEAEDKAREASDIKASLDASLTGAGGTAHWLILAGLDVAALALCPWATAAALREVSP